MKCAIIALLAATVPNAQAVKNPIDKVLQLLTDMQTKIVGEGEEAQKMYSKAAEWCEERSKNLGFEVKTAKAEIEGLKATIEDETASSSSLRSKVETLAADISTDEGDLEAATSIRTKEKADFEVEQKELSDVIDALQRAIGLIEREMQKGGAAMVQVQGAANIAQAMEALVHASAINSEDAAHLTALVQSRNAEDDASFGAPAASVYESHSGGIVETLEGLLDKAEAQLDKARKTETAATHNFEMLKQSLEDEIKFASADMAKAKEGIAQSEETKATAEGDLDVTSKSLKGDTDALADLHQTCMTKAVAEGDLDVTSKSLK